MVDSNNDFIQLELYQKVCDKLKDSNELEKLSAQFSCLKTDEERVKFVFELNIIEDIVEILPSFTPKSTSKSKDFRSEGNVLFKKKHFKESLEYYNQSILHAPKDDQKTASLAYANRSAVLFHLKEYKLSLQDIETSLEWDYPEELHYKILDRQGRCCRLLGKMTQAQSIFTAALKSIEKSNLKEKEKATWKKDLKKKLKDCQEEKSLCNSLQMKQLDIIRLGSTALPKLPSSNEKYIATSKAFDVTMSASKGRYPVAAQDIDVGEVLVVEKPFASVLLQVCEKTHCHHCLKRCIAPMPCQQCSNVQYCSLECATESWKQYHVYECNHLEHIQNAGKYGHLALRTLLKAGLSVTQNVSSLNTDFKGLGLNDENKYDPSDYHTIYNLIGHTESRSVSDLFQRAVIAVYLVLCVQNTDFFKEKNKTDSDRVTGELLKAGGIILRHMQSFPCNAHEISELQLSLGSVETSVTMEIGAGIYATLSLFNHSCNPGVTRFFYGDTCIVRALKGITAGQEIADNYGVLSALTPRNERQRTLASQYYFDCSCEACIQDLPLFREIALITKPTLKCDSCGSALQTSSEHRIKCQICKADQDLSLKTKLLEKSEDRLKQAVDELFSGDVSNSLPKIHSHLRILEKNVVPPWHGFNSCRELMKQCYNILANCHLVE